MIVQKVVDGLWQYLVYELDKSQEQAHKVQMILG